MRVYGKRFYRDDYPLYLFAEAILGVRDAAPHFRRELQLAWLIAERWEADEPPEPRAVLPVSAVRAIAAVAFVWN